MSIIVAVAQNGVIGRAGGLPWRLPDEMKHFRQTTMGHHLVVGRKTWESIGRPLPGRTMIVVTRDPAYRADECVVAPSLSAALEHARAAGDDEVFIAGGGQLYREALPRTDRVYLTRIEAVVEGDVTFPPLSPDAWVEHGRREHPADDRHPHAFTILVLDRT